jgi:uncharacterized protein (TIGR00369 family)
MSDAIAPTVAAMAREEAERLLGTCDIHRYLGLELTEWSHGHAGFIFRPPASVRSGDTGFIHGGALATALDTAACFAVIAATGVDCSTIDLRTDFLRPASAQELIVTGTCVRAGRRIGVADATATAPLDGKVVALARGTFTW